MIVNRIELSRENRPGRSCGHQMSVPVPFDLRFWDAVGLAIERQRLVLGYQHGGRVLCDVGGTVLTCKKNQLTALITIMVIVGTQVNFISLKVNGRLCKVCKIPALQYYTIIYPLIPTEPHMS